MNFSTVPPWNSTMPFIRLTYRARSVRNASGSVDSPSAVEPVTSQNNTVTVLRCSRASPVSGAVQNPQNWKPSGFSLPQAGQAATARVYDDYRATLQTVPMQLKEFLIGLDRRGRGFEDAARWFLLNDPVYRQQVKRTWLWQDWPGCWGRDCGIDLVAETVDGEFWAIQ